MKFFLFVILPALICGAVARSFNVSIAIFIVAGFFYWVYHQGMSEPEEPSSPQRHISRNTTSASFSDNHDILKRLNALETEVAQLKTRLAQLERHDAPSSETASSAESAPEPTVSAVSEFDDLPQATVAKITPLEPVEPALLEPAPEPTPEPVASVELPTEPIVAPKTRTIPPSKRMPKAYTMDEETISQPNPLVAWFMRGNPLLKTGVVILFLGLAFLLRYASERVHVPIELRYISVFLSGIVATVGGWKLQAKKREYGLVLQGFGVAVMYLTSLASLKLHSLLPAPVVFVVMVSLVALMTTLAVKQNAKIMAQVALIGGLSAPVLVSDGSGQYLVLFSYLALLNTGVAMIAWFKAWRSLNLIGFIGTFGIATAWGGDAYTPQHFATTEPFLLYHWVLYTLIACFFARRTLVENALTGRLARIPDNASLARIWATITAYGNRIGVLDSGLLFGTAITSFGLQYQMVETWHNAGAWSALLWAGVYGGFAVYFMGQDKRLAVMKQAFFALMLVFITLAIPLGLEQKWTATAWALEASLVYVFGLLQKQPQTRLSALVVYLLAGAVQLEDLERGTNTVLSGSLIGAFLATVSGVFMYAVWALYRREHSAVWERNMQAGALLLALAHALTLPMLMFGNLGTMLTLSVYALVFAWAQFKQPQTVLTGFTAWSAVLAVGFGWAYLRETAIVPPFYWYAILGAVFLATAYPLHKARWLDEQSKDKGNFYTGWLILLMAIWANHIALKNGLSDVHALPNITWWHFPILFGGLTALAYGLKWHEAKRATLAFTPILTSAMQNQDLFSQPIHAIGLLSVSGGLSGVIVRIQQFGDSNRLAIRGMNIALLTLLWTQFLGQWADAHIQQPAWQMVWWWLAPTIAYVWLMCDRAYRPETRLSLHAFGFTLFSVMWTILLARVGEIYTSGVWAQLMWIALPVLMWLWIYAQRNSTFIQKYQTVYWQYGSMVITAYLAIWLLGANISEPRNIGLPYLPILNPLELTTFGILWQMTRWLKAWLPSNQQAFPELKPQTVQHCALALGFMMLSMMIIRLWYFYDNVAWDMGSFLQSFGLQANLSIVWALVAIGLMVRGNQRRLRPLWLIGASLMGVVVVKLFLVELGNSGGIARIVSFIVVGILLLLVGWFAPAPPKQSDE